MLLRPHSRQLLPTLALLLAGLVLVSCGGSDDASDDDDIDAAILDDLLGDSTDDDDAESDEVDSSGDEGPSAIPDQGSFSGIATLVVDGDTYEINSTDCVPEQPEEIVDSGTRFHLTGTGQARGDDLYGKVLRTETDIDGDGEAEVLHTINIEVGGEPNAQAPSDKPSLLVQLTEGDVEEGLGSLGVSFEPGRLAGSGEIFDRNGVLAPEGEPLRFTFVATCVADG